MRQFRVYSRLKQKLWRIIKWKQRRRMRHKYYRRSKNGLWQHRLNSIIDYYSLSAYCFPYIDMPHQTNSRTVSDGSYNHRISRAYCEKLLQTLHSSHLLMLASRLIMGPNANRLISVVTTLRLLTSHIYMSRNAISLAYFGAKSCISVQYDPLLSSQTAGDCLGRYSSSPA